MAHNERQRQKAAQKKAAKAKERQARRRNMTRFKQKAAGARAEEVAKWPTIETVAGQNWADKGAEFPVIVIRRHSGGATAAAFFELDLGDAGVTDAEWTADSNEVQRRLAELSETTTLVYLDPGQVKRLVEGARELGKKNDYDLPEGFEEAFKLFGAVEARGLAVETGVAEEAPAASLPEPAEDPGLLGKLKKWVGLS